MSTNHLQNTLNLGFHRFSIQISSPNHQIQNHQAQYFDLGVSQLLPKYHHQKHSTTSQISLNPNQLSKNHNQTPQNLILSNPKQIKNNTIFKTKTILSQGSNQQNSTNLNTHLMNSGKMLQKHIIDLNKEQRKSSSAKNQMKINHFNSAKHLRFSTSQFKDQSKDHFFSQTQQIPILKQSNLNIQPNKKLRNFSLKQNIEKIAPYNYLGTIYETKNMISRFQSQEQSISKMTSPKSKQLPKTLQKQSNKKLITNAIKNLCFPGEVNRKQRERYLQIIDKSFCEYFIFLFKQPTRKVIKGIYSYDNLNDRVKKINGEKCPETISGQDNLIFYRYDSGAKQFKVIEGCRTFSISVHGICLK